MTEPASRWVRPLSTGPVFHDGVEALAAEVRDGDTISLGGFHFCRQPVRLAAALAARGVRGLRHVQWGGSLALEILLEAGAVGHLTFCFSNLDIFGLAPQFRRALEDGSVEHLELTALELHHAVLAAQMNLDTLPLQVPAGSWRAAGHGGADVGDSPALALDVVLLHAQRADRNGNVELYGPLGLDRTLALAGRRVLVTVEEVVEPGELDNAGAIVPRQFVTGIAVSPGGAWPTSCPGHYVADYTELAARTGGAGPTGAGPAPAGPIPAGPVPAGPIPPAPVPAGPIPAAPVSAGPVPGVADAAAAPAGVGTRGPSAFGRRAAAVDWTRQRWPEPVPRAAGPADGVADLMVAWLARKLDDRSVCSVGAVSPLPTTAYLLAKHTTAPALTIISASGGCVDVAGRFMSLSFGEAADVRSAASLCGGDDSYRWYYQQSRVTHEVVSAAQIDGAGRTGNSWIDRPDGRRLRLPGQGGMADVANMHRNFILYATRQSPRQLVETVDLVSSARAVSSDADRARLGYGPGAVELLTDLGVFALDPATGRFALAGVHPGVSVEEVRDRTGFAVTVAADLAITPPVTPAERAAIEAVDPFGVRFLEFTPASGRHRAIEAILLAERQYLETS